LKKNIQNAFVFGCDISEAAIVIAQENAKLNNVDVNFFTCDILTETDKIEKSDWDIIVSNPPYITNREKEYMLSNVLKYEPHLALFVPNNDPLMFYRVISDLAIEKLVSGGKLYFEINEAYGEQTANMLAETGFKNVQVFRDINGKQRMVSAIK